MSTIEAGQQVQTPLPTQTAGGTLIQRACACGTHTVGGGECSECRKKNSSLVQRFSEHPSTSFGVPPIVHDVVRSSGQALDQSTLGFMESRFGRDFSGVRLHTDSTAAESARAIGALAYTAGRHIVFDAGRYAPGTHEGRRLLAHELTHVAQQGGVEPAQRLAIDEADSGLEREAERVADFVVASGGSTNPPDDNGSGTSVSSPEAGIGRMGGDAEAAGPAMLPIAMAGSARVGRLIQRVPSPGSNFGTYRYCGFGITTSIPGFIQSHFTGSFDVDYTSGCTWLWGNTWASIWELYDASDTKLDSSEKWPFGAYSIGSSHVTSGTPGNGSSAWSLWYRVTRSQPWLTDDNDAYPYHYRTFPVYALPIRDQSTTLAQETGPVVWQNNFTPAEDGASLEYNFSSTASRTTTDTQSTSVSTTISGDRSENIGFDYEGLTGGFSNRLSLSMTQTMSREHSVSVSTSQTTSTRFTQPNLRAGVTYQVTARPLYHIIDGSVGMINHRDGVITSGGDTISGGIRVLRGMDIRIDSNQSSATARGRWSCEASCNVEGTQPQCTGRVTGSSSGHSSEDEACREAKRDATQKAPRGCYARHCRCFNCTNR